MEKELELIQAKYQLGLVMPKDLPHSALHLMELGYRSVTLGRIAILENPDTLEAKELFEIFLKEIGAKMLDILDAVKIVSQNIAKGMVEGKIALVDGVKEISEVYDLTNSPVLLKNMYELEIQYMDALYGEKNFADDPKYGKSFYKKIQEKVLAEIKVEAQKLAYL